MNCEKYQELLSDLVDGRILSEDRRRIEAHVIECGTCTEVRDDFVSIVGYCREHRGEYEAVPNEQALWLRISNLIEAESPSQSRADIPSGAGWWFRLMNRSWQLSFPQLATSIAATVLVAVLVTFIGLRAFNGSGPRTAGLSLASSAETVQDRYRQQAQVIDYWNQRVELNKARWSPQMRETFDRNMSVIDAAVNDSMGRLNQNPHDEISEDILNAALGDKIALLKEFAEL